jgi:hypothetical protein
MSSKPGTVHFNSQESAYYDHIDAHEWGVLARRDGLGVDKIPWHRIQKVTHTAEDLEQ